MTDWEAVSLIASFTIVILVSILLLFASVDSQPPGVGWVLGGFVLGGLFWWHAQTVYDQIQTTDHEPSPDPQPATHERAAPENKSGFEFGEPEPVEPATEDSESNQKSRVSAVIDTIVPVAVGVILALYIAHQDFAFPAFALGAGAIVTAVILLAVQERTYYAGAGAVYCVGTAVVIDQGYFPATYAESPFAALLGLGLVSALIVATHLGIGVVIRRQLSGVTGEDTAMKIYDAVAAVLGLLGIVWAVINIHERAVRYGGVTVGGTLGFVLNFLGIELPIPWFIAGGVDATLIMYVGAILIGFHTLESIHTTWRATKATAKAGVNAGKIAGWKGASTVSTVSDRMRRDS